MKILDRLPVYDEPSLIDVQGDVLQIWRNQIIVWVSVNDVLRPFPAILDTGHSHNLTISARHLKQWTGTGLKQIGDAKVGTVRVPQFEATLYLHGNVRRSRRLSGRTHPLRMEQGITVMPDSPRLPLLGLKAIIGNELRLVIDGKRREVTLKTGWL